MEFEVTILGSNSAIPAHGRNQSSQLLKVGGTHILLDCGEGTQIQLRKFKLRFSKIDFIFISHLHGDHYLGLMGLIFSFQLHNRSKLLTIFGPAGLDEILTLQLKHSNTRLNFPLRFVCTDPDNSQLILEENNFKVYSFPLKHRLPCTGFAIEEKVRFRNLKREKLQDKKIPVEAINQLRNGMDYKDESGKVIYALDEYTHPPRKARKYAYCSDTCFDLGLVPYIKGANILYHEATFANDQEERAKETFHTTAAQAGIVAREAEVDRLLIGHYSTRYLDLNPLLNEARANFPKTFLSEEGITYSVD